MFLNEKNKLKINYIKYNFGYKNLQKLKPKKTSYFFLIWENSF